MVVPFVVVVIVTVTVGAEMVDVVAGTKVVSTVTPDADPALTAEAMETPIEFAAAELVLCPEIAISRPVAVVAIVVRAAVAPAPLAASLATVVS